MKFVIPLVALVAAPPAHAQIFADFSVSQGATSLGTFRARLDHDKAPRTCANFIGLATGRRPWIDVATGGIRKNTPFYNGLTFHRLIHNFMIQGGSPNGLGTDGPGYAIQDEYHGSLRHSGRYILSMAKGGLPGSGGSQFFITLRATPELNDKHSVFGEVIQGQSVIDGFASAASFPTDRSVAGASPVDPLYADRPVTPITINSVTISGPDSAGFDLNAPALMLPSVRPTELSPFRDSAASTFTLTFDRGFQSENLIHYSENLRDWTYFRHIHSRDAADGYSYQISGVALPRFFVRSATVDYGLLPNPSTDLFSSGKQLILSDRGGNTLTISPNGSGGGTWSHSNGSSGNLTQFVTADYSLPSGATSHTSSRGHLFPLCSVGAAFDGPVGPGNWTALDLVLSFHAPLSGWVEGAALVSGNPNEATVLQSFTVHP